MDNIETQQTVTIIARKSIRAITSVTVDGQTHQLGEQRDFRRNDELASFLPNNSRPSFAWVRLLNGETLNNHRHPVKSMILVCSGSVQLTGDDQRLLQEGDIVCVPPHSLHGFRTHPGEVFHGLSIQFDGKGLYEDENSPRVDFTQDLSPLSTLEKLNQKLLQLHTQNSLFHLIESGRLQQAPELRDRFVSALHIWSKYFQRMLQARQAVCVNNELYTIYREHFEEEFNHDAMLCEHYNVDSQVYYPALEAAGSWFVSQMYHLDEAEKIVVVHLVVESSGHAFGEACKGIFEHSDSRGDYFSTHAHADSDHAMIGKSYLNQLSPSIIQQLVITCQRAWDHMNLIHEYIANWTLEQI